MVTGEPAEGFVRAHFDDTPLGAAPKWWTATWTCRLHKYKSMVLDIALDVLRNGSFYVELPANRETTAAADLRFRRGWHWQLATLVVGLTTLVLAVAGVFSSSMPLVVAALAIALASCATAARGYQLLLAKDVAARREGDQMTMTAHPRFVEELVRINPPGTVRVEHVRWDASVHEAAAA